MIGADGSMKLGRGKDRCDWLILGWIPSLQSVTLFFY